MINFKLTIISIFALFFSLPTLSDDNPVKLIKGNHYGIINIPKFIKLLPEKSDGIIKSKTVLERPGGGVRVFRLYDAVPQHYHLESDAILYILSGKARFKIENEDLIEAGKGDLLFWSKGTIHGNPEIVEGPVDVLVFDIPARDESDTIWADPTKAPGFLNNNGE
jgi:mannose-6-phosphate isomerase-like protein (cupin superfamily)